MASIGTVSDVMAKDESGGETSGGRLLFCPFCRECYEDRARCPEHELELVEFQDLPRQAHERAVGWEDPVVPWEIRFGRLELVLGVAAALIGFFALPLVVGTFDDRAISWTASDIAMQRARNLWSVPFVAAMFVVFLYRRRTPLSMRGARLAGVVLALMPAVSLAYSLWQVDRGVMATQGAVAAEWGAGVWVIAAASVSFLVGALRFGSMPGEGSLPHGAAGDDEPARIDAERPAKKRKRRR